MLVVIVLLIVSIPFVPPIYNRYTKPLYKNYVDAKEWYLDSFGGKGDEIFG